MTLLVGLDLGTTTITALALDTAGSVRGLHTVANRAETTASSDRQRGRSEWDADKIATLALCCLRELGEQLGDRRRDVAGVGLTGQQHGGLVLGADGMVRIPLINWQDRRGEDSFPGSNLTFTQMARHRLGEEVVERTGCRLATGFLAVSLFWLQQHELLQAGDRACFLGDYVASRLTAGALFTDPTFAGSAGVYDVRHHCWGDDLLAALDLPSSLMPPVVPSGSSAGALSQQAAEATGLPAGIPVLAPLGDNQASFLGSVAEPDHTLLVNVGTGGQVAATCSRFLYDPLLETRPFPGDDYLLVCPGLCGGRVYALLETFFRRVAQEVAGTPAVDSVYAAMNTLAAEVPAGCEGVVCEPFFSGTRQDPTFRGAWSGLSPQTLTPGHLTRSLLEGMARAFASGANRIVHYLDQPRRQLIGAGNGMRENPLLARLVSEAIQLPLRTPLHREEAAYGAGLLAATALGVFPDLATAGKVLPYASRSSDG